MVLDAIAQDQVWPALLVRWELGLLGELGFGLDLSKCAATGATEISPMSRRGAARPSRRRRAKPFGDRLFRLPAFLKGGVDAPAQEVIEGLRLAAFFLERHVFEPRGQRMPEQQDWIIRALAERPH